MVRVTEALFDKIIHRPPEEVDFPRLHFVSGHRWLNQDQKDTGHKEIKQK